MLNPGEQTLVFSPSTLDFFSADLTGVNPVERQSYPVVLLVGEKERVRPSTEAAPLDTVLVCRHFPVTPCLIAQRLSLDLHGALLRAQDP